MMKRIISIVAVIALLATLLCACGTEQAGKGSEAAAAKPLAEVFTEIKDTYNVTDLMEYKNTAALKRFYGIEEADVEDFAGGKNNSGVNQEEIVMVKATGAEAAGRIETALKNQLNAKLKQNKDYNPEQYAMIKKCSVDVDGNYVSMFISPDAAAMKADFRRAIGLE